MSALPRPALLPGAHRELNDALHDLHRDAGWPSLRTLARRAGCSHTTVSHAFSGARLPSWGLLELLVEAMGGDVHHLHGLWLAASSDGDHPTGHPDGRPVARPAGTPTDRTGADPTGVGQADRATAIAGRRAELDVVRRHLEDGGGLLLLTGEAGIGKTRLLAAAAARVPPTVLVATGCCLPLGTEVPLLPVTDVLRTVLLHDDGSWFAAALSDCPRFVVSSLARVLPELGPQVTTADPDDEWSRQRLFTAVSTLLVRLAQRRPLAVVVEDLQWADRMTFDLMEHLVVRGLPSPVVATLRPHDPSTPEQVREWTARIRRTSVVVDLELGPLSREETAAQLALELGHEPTAATVDRIHRRSLGHPFFTQQLALHTHDGAGPLPRLLADLLDRRLGGLSEQGWQVVRLLAVADRPLPAWWLAEVSGLSSGEVVDALRELAARQLVADAAPSDRAAPDATSLRHPLLGEAVRRRLVAGEDLRTSRVVAESLPRLTGVPAAEVAAHWQAAGDPAGELGWRLRAARDAADAFAGRVAAAHWARLLAIWPEGASSVGSPPVRRPEVWTEMLDGHDLAGDLELGDRAAAHALAEAGTWRPAERAELLRRAATYRAGLFDLGGAERLLDQAVTLHRDLPPGAGLVRALTQKSQVRNRQGRHEEAARLLVEARRVLDLLDDDPLRRELLARMAWQDSVTGRLDRAVVRMAEVARMTSTGPEPRRDLQLAVLHTDVLLKACRPPEEVEAAAAPGLAAIDAWGLENLRGNLLRANVALAWMRAGRLDRAARVLAAAAPDEGVGGEWGVHLVRARVDCALGQLGLARERCAHLLGRRPAAADVLAPVMAELDFWEGTGDDAFEPLLRACVAMPNLLVPGEAGDSLVLAARAAAELAARSGPHSSTTARRRMAGRLEGLLELIGHDPFGPGAVPVDRHAAPQWYAEVARLLDTETTGGWRAAAEGWDTVARPHDAAYSRWRAARVALRQGDRGAADRMLRRAARDAREHQPLSAAIRATVRGG